MQSFYKNDTLIKKSDYYETGEKKFEWAYTSGKKDGISKKYYKSGQLAGDLFFKNDIQTGLTMYYENGALKAKYKYESGKKNGISKGYYKNGQLKTEWLFKNGELIKKTSY